jgi:hypothetical protein
VQSAITARSVRGWDNGEDEKTMLIRAIVSSVVARAQLRDDLWFGLASDELGVPESVLRNHATHGADLSLAILIHVVHLQFSLFSRWHWPCREFSKVLEAASKFNILDTSRELQNEFCTLWNELIRSGASRWHILRPIRNVYLTLHVHTDSAPTRFSAATSDEDDILYQRSSYPLCNVPGHHPDSTPHIHDVSTSTAIPRSVLHDNTALVPTSSPDAPSLSVTTPVHVDENPSDVPLLDSMSVLSPLCHAHHMDTEGVQDSATSPDPAAAGTERDNPSSRTIPLTTRETPTYISSVTHPLQ